MTSAPKSGLSTIGLGERFGSQPINCKACLRDLHDECNKQNCLCENNNHGVKEPSLKDGVKVSNEPMTLKGLMDVYSVEKALRFDNKSRIDSVVKVLRHFFHYVTIRESGMILRYNGKIYDRFEAESHIKEWTEKLIPEGSKKDKLEVIDKLKAQTYIDNTEFDKDANLIVVENGILNLETGQLAPHTPTHYSNVLFPVNYVEPSFDDIEENLEDTLFWKFLKSSFTVDGKFRKKDFDTVLEMMASVFIKRQIDAKAFMMLGNGENGKSVCLGFLEAMVGRNNVTHIPLQDLAHDTFAPADLHGKSANIFTDLEKDDLRHSGKLKAIVDNEGVRAHIKHGQPFTLYPFAKLIFSCNRFPKTYDKSQGFYRKWIIIKWQRNFEKDPESIPKLREKLIENKTETDEVFSNLVKIASDLNEAGKFTLKKDWEVTKKQWEENADPLGNFIENYILDSDKNKTKRETYQFYKNIMFEKGEIPLSMGQFSKEMSTQFEDSKNDGSRIWLNIDLKEPVQTKLKEKEE